MTPEQFDLKEHMIHKPPMLLVDKLLEESAKKAKTSFFVREECIFLDGNNILAKSALIEIAAQSFAAADIYQKTTRAKEPAKGFLVSVRDFKFTGDAHAGDEIICHVEEVNDIEQMHIIEARLFVNDTCISEGELRIFEMQENRFNP